MKTLAIFSLLLASTVTASAQVIVASDATRVSSINVSGVELLTGGGIYLIGSKNGDDNPSTNYSSVGSNGSSMTHDGPAFTLSFWVKSSSTTSTTLGFTSVIGPVAEAIKTISLPLDFDKQRIGSLDFNGTSYYLNNESKAKSYKVGSLVSYANIPQVYPIYDNGVYLGSTGVADTRKPLTWGTAVGSSASVTVNVKKSSHYASLAFYNHFATNNMEIRFGSFKKGEKASIEGEIVITAKQASSGWTYQAETQLLHQIGRADAEGWSVRIGDSKNQYMSFGPYVSGISAGNRKATFRMLVDNTTADNSPVVTIDIYDSASARVLASRKITRREFSAGSYKYSDFSVDFISKSSQRLEFRAFWHGTSYVKQDYVTIK